MTLTQALRRLSTAISGATSLVPGENAEVLTEEALTQSLLEASVVYSTYRPATRRIGEAQTVKSAALDTDEILVLGGLFSDGDQILVDFCGAGEDSYTIDSVVLSTIEDENTGVSVPLSVITLTSDLTASVEEGALIVPDVAANVRGLAIREGRATYALPRDFLSPDQDSFNALIGSKGYVKRTGSYYDAVYGLTGPMTNTGPGYLINVGGYTPYSRAFNNPNGGSAIHQMLQYRFILQGRPTLTISPTPTAARYMDFYYNSVHTISSVPLVDQEAFMSYARYSALLKLTTYIGHIIDTSATEINMTERAHMNVKELRQLADIALKEFNDAIRDVPYAESG